MRQQVAQGGEGCFVIGFGHDPCTVILQNKRLWALRLFRITANGFGQRRFRQFRIRAQAQGYLNLMRLNTHLYIDGAIDSSTNLPQVTLDELAQHADGLVCLTGGPDGPLGRFHATGQHAKARALLERLTQIYPNRLLTSYTLTRPTPGEVQPAVLDTFGQPANIAVTLALTVMDNGAVLKQTNAGVQYALFGPREALDALYRLKQIQKAWR